MARTARVKSEFGIFHITQHGGSCRELFVSNEDRERFISILNRSKSKFDFKLHGYCLINPNSYDLIIDVNGGDLSKIMKSINIAYAMYAKCEGKLFSDRYKSTLLESDEDLNKIKDKLRHKKERVDDEHCFNMCFDTFDLTHYKTTLLAINFDDCQGCLTCVDKALTKLQRYATNNNICLEDINKDRELRNQLIKTFRQSSTLSLKSLGKLFGGLSESSISKIINS